MKILYIAGLAHSGSTYLSRVLNQHSDIFSAGELTDLHEQFEYGFKGCSCEKNPQQKSAYCSFWPDIVNPISQNFAIEEVARLSLKRSLEWFKALRNFALNIQNDAFKEGNRKLFRSLSAETNSKIIIDTSKTPWRLIPLYQYFPDTIQILHLIRNPSNQVVSKMKRDAGFYRAALTKYLRRNWIYHRFSALGNQYMRLKFEEFIRNPDSKLKEIFDWTEVAYEDPFNKPQTRYHHLLGSDARSSDSLPPPDPSRLQNTANDRNYFRSSLLKILKRKIYD